MSTHSAGIVGSRVEAASDEATSPADGSLGGLSRLATAIEGVAALIAAEKGMARDGSAALERIADIAFVLHERDLEASLCDALDAAVRELVQADQLKQANAESTQQALASLRELVRRIDGTVAAAQVGQGTEAHHDMNDIAAAGSAGAEYDTVDDTMRRHGLFSAVAREDDALAQAVASLSATLHPAGEPVDAASARRHEPTEAKATPLDLQALPDPNEDPGDLFEPLAGNPASKRNELAASVEAPAPLQPAVRHDASSNAVESPPPSDAAAAGQPPAAPGPVHDDPLAPLHALSEEELIALFS